MSMSEDLREYRRELQRLYLELIPPFLSVATLIVVTVFAIRDAVDDLSQEDEDREEDVNVKIMLVFSGANLLLDVANIACFARAHQAFGLTGVRREHGATRYSVREPSELERLVRDDGQDDDDSLDGQTGGGFMYNLNMCSAWTVCFTCGDPFPL